MTGSNSITDLPLITRLLEMVQQSLHGAVPLITNATTRSNTAADDFIVLISLNHSGPPPSCNRLFKNWYKSMSTGPQVIRVRAGVGKFAPSTSRHSGKLVWAVVIEG